MGGFGKHGLSRLTELTEHQSVEGGERSGPAPAQARPVCRLVAYELGQVVVVTDATDRRAVERGGGVFVSLVQRGGRAGGEGGSRDLF